jgi:hypothetical protein
MIMAAYQSLGTAALHVASCVAFVVSSRSRWRFAVVVPLLFLGFLVSLALVRLPAPPSPPVFLNGVLLV